MIARTARRGFGGAAGVLWLSAGAAFGYLRLVQLGLTGEYAVSDPGSATLNAVAALTALAIGVGLLRRASSSGLRISVAGAAVVVVGGGYQVTQGVGGMPLALAIVAAGLAGCLSALALGRVGRWTRRGMAGAMGGSESAGRASPVLDRLRGDPGARSKRARHVSVPWFLVGLSNAGMRVRAVLARPRIRGLSFRRTVAILALASFAAALIVARVSGAGGPWLWQADLPPFEYPLASVYHNALARGQLPLWSDLMGFGFPLYAEGQIGAFYPPNWLIYMLPPLQALDVSRVLHLTLAGVGTGVIVLRLAGSRSGAVVAALLAVAAGGIVAKLEWTSFIVEYGWAPWVLLPLLRRPVPSRMGLVASAVAWGVQALGFHPIPWVLTGLGAAAVLMVRRSWRPMLPRVVAFGLIGVAIGAVQLVPTLLLLSESVRAAGLDKVLLFQFSATPFDVLGLAFANAFVPFKTNGWDLGASWYPGGPWAVLEGAAYIGLPALALAGAGIGLRRARSILAAAVLFAAVPVVAALKLDVWAAVPVLNGLRHLVKAYTMLGLVLAVAAGIGVSRIARTPGRSRLVILAVLVPLLAYGITLAIVVLAPGLFEAVIKSFSPRLPSGAERGFAAVAFSTLTQPWPLLLEVALGPVAVWLVRGRRRSVGVVAVVGVMAVALPLAFSPLANPTAPESSFDLTGSALVSALRAQTPHAVLTVGQATYYSSTQPNQLNLVGLRDMAYFSSLDLAAGDQLLANLNNEGSDHVLARAVGVDTLVTFGQPCGPAEVGTAAEDDAHICHLDAARPPYWLPANAALVPPAAASSPITPVDAAVDPARALAGAHPATVLGDAGAVVIVNAPSDGYVFIDRSWYPAWQATVDGHAVTPYRAWGGQLFPVNAGIHKIEEHFFPWDAVIGVAISGTTLLVIAISFMIGRRRRWRARRVAAGQR